MGSNRAIYVIVGLRATDLLERSVAFKLPITPPSAQPICSTTSMVPRNVHVGIDPVAWCKIAVGIHLLWIQPIRACLDSTCSQVCSVANVLQNLFRGSWAFSTCINTWLLVWPVITIRFASTFGIPRDAHSANFLAALLLDVAYHTVFNDAGKGLHRGRLNQGGSALTEAVLFARGFQRFACGGIVDVRMVGNASARG